MNTTIEKFERLMPNEEDIAQAEERTEATEKVDSAQHIELQEDNEAHPTDKD